MTPARQMNPVSVRAALLLGPLVLALAFSFSRVATEPFHVPSDADYQAAHDVMTADQFNVLSDAWAVLPPWSLRAWKFLGAWRPISGDGLYRRPLHRYSRLFVVAEPDAAPHLDPLLARLGAPTADVAAGRLHVLRFDLGAPRVTYDFRAHLMDAVISIANPRGETVQCNQPAPNGRACPGRGNWQRVTRQWLLVSENGDDAMWAHPPPPGQSLNIAFENVPMGDTIWVTAGHTRDGADRASGEVRIHVLVDDAEVGVIKRMPRFDFAPQAVDTKAYAGTTHRVTFSVETDQDANNHFAFDAFAANRATP